MNAIVRHMMARKSELEHEDATAGLTANEEDELSWLNEFLGRSRPGPPEWPADALHQFGDLVRKKGRASWRGRVVGWYRTDLTALGFAVESVFEPGSVQIYPQTALEPWDGSD